MARLITLNDMARDNNINLKDTTGGIYDPSGKTAYGSDGTKVGTVTSALVDPSGGRIRYLVVDTGGWFFSKEVLVPVGMGRIEDDGVYFDSLTKDQVKSMREYRVGDDIADEDMGREAVMLTGRDDHSRYVAPMATATTATTASTATTTEPVLTAGPTTSFNYRDDDANDKLFKAPQRLQLLEERLNVSKIRERVGEVEVGKRVETHTEKVNVPLEREEVVIERHAVSGGQAVTGAVLGSAETIKVELEAERANVTKQAFVVEEVEIGKRTQTETQVVTETIGKEVLEVERNGQMVTDASGKTTATTTTTGKQDESLLDRAGDAVRKTADNVGDAVRNTADNITGNNKR